MSPNEIPGGLDDLEPIFDGADLEPLLDGDDLEPIEPETPVKAPEVESTLEIPEQDELSDISHPEPTEEAQPVEELVEPEPEAEPDPEPEAESLLVAEPAPWEVIEPATEPEEASAEEGEAVAQGVAAVGAAAIAGDTAAEAAAETPATTGAGEDKGKRGRQRQGKRELERTTLLFLKVSQYLLIISFLPFAGPSGSWLPGMVEKLACVLGIWLAYQGQLAYAGEKALGLMKGLVKDGTRNATLLGLFVGVLGFVPFATGFEFDWTIFREKFTLLCAGFTLAHIVGYQHGGKFNPGVASLLIVPFFAGLGGLMYWIADWGEAIPVVVNGAVEFRQFSPGIGAIGVMGALAAFGCGSLAIWSFFQALKEAKREGEAKKKAALEARRAARKAGKKVPPRTPRKPRS